MSREKVHQEQDSAFDQMKSRALRAMLKLTEWSEYGMADGLVIKELRIQGPHQTGQDYRVIVKADAEGQRFVAFHNGTDIQELMNGLVSRIEAGQLRWKEDTPWSPPGPVSATGG